MNRFVILILTGLIISSQSLAQKITEKYAYQEVYQFPKLPISVAYDSFQILMIDDPTGKIVEYAKKNVNLSELECSNDSNLSLRFDMFGEKYTQLIASKQEQITLQASLSSKMGIVLYEGERIFDYFDVSMVEFEVVDKSSQMREEVDYSFSIDTTFHVDEKLAFLRENENGSQSLSDNFKNYLIEMQSRLLIDKAVEKINTDYNPSTDFGAIKYLGLKKHAEEDSFNEILKQYKKDRNGVKDYDLASSKAVAFWKDKAENGLDVMSKSVANFNLSMVYLGNGDLPKANTYFEKAKSLGAQIPEKRLVKAGTEIEEKLIIYNTLFDESGNYVFSGPMEVKFKGYVGYASDGTLIKKTTEEYNKWLAANSKLKEYNEHREIRFLPGTVTLKDGLIIKGQLYTTLGWAVGSKNTSVSTVGRPGKGITVNTISDNGKKKSNYYKTSEVIEFSTGERKYLSLSKDGSDEKNFLEVISEYDKGVLLRSIASIDMPYFAYAKSAEGKEFVYLATGTKEELELKIGEL